MTEEIKKAFESAKTDEEKKAVLEKYKDTIKTLSEEELEDITGGCTIKHIIGADNPKTWAPFRYWRIE